MSKKRWLISYFCAGYDHGRGMYGEATWEGSLGAWRIAQLEFEDGPYIIVNAAELSLLEWERLNGVVG